MICSSAFWKQKCENLKDDSLTFFKFQSISTYSFQTTNPFRTYYRGNNRQFYCTGVIICNRTRQLWFVSVDRQTFLGFEMTSNSQDTSPLMVCLTIVYSVGCLART